MTAWEQNHLVRRLCETDAARPRVPLELFLDLHLLVEELRSETFRPFRLLLHRSELPLQQLNLPLGVLTARLHMLPLRLVFLTLASQLDLGVMHSSAHLSVLVT